ncbi:MAG: hypothetical protein WDN30_13085 [Pararobbsia sp.]
MILARLVAQPLAPRKPRIYATHRKTIPPVLAANILFHEGGRAMIVDNGQTFCPIRCEEYQDLALHLMMPIRQANRIRHIFLPARTRIDFL